ncbi:MAG: hypothetical protein M1820_009583 [Bogoriella megaspora]|nr:MAG: hypothetical protein M1820_009583 [Bogoriella megaspora]
MPSHKMYEDIENAENTLYTNKLAGTFAGTLRGIRRATHSVRLQRQRSPEANVDTSSASSAGAEPGESSQPGSSPAKRSSWSLRGSRTLRPRSSPPSTNASGGIEPENSGQAVHSKSTTTTAKFGSVVSKRFSVNRKPGDEKALKPQTEPSPSTSGAVDVQRSSPKPIIGRPKLPRPTFSSFDSEADKLLGMSPCSGRPSLEDGFAKAKTHGLRSFDHDVDVEGSPFGPSGRPYPGSPCVPSASQKEQPSNSDLTSENLMMRGSRSGNTCSNFVRSFENEARKEVGKVQASTAHATKVADGRPVIDLNHGTALQHTSDIRESPPSKLPAIHFNPSISHFQPGITKPPVLNGATSWSLDEIVGRSETTEMPRRRISLPEFGTSVDIGLSSHSSRGSSPNSTAVKFSSPIAVTYVSLAKGSVAESHSGANEAHLDEAAMAKPLKPLSLSSFDSDDVDGGRSLARPATKPMRQLHSEDDLVTNTNLSRKVKCTDMPFARLWQFQREQRERRGRLMLLRYNKGHETPRQESPSVDCKEMRAQRRARMAKEQEERLQIYTRSNTVHDSNERPDINQTEEEMEAVLLSGSPELRPVE